jgi:HEAT repeat protein
VAGSADVAVQALGTWRITSSLPLVQKALNDPDLDVRMAAEEAIRQLRW